MLFTTLKNKLHLLPFMKFQNSRYQGTYSGSLNSNLMKDEVFSNGQNFFNHYNLVRGQVLSRQVPSYCVDWFGEVLDYNARNVPPIHGCLHIAMYKSLAGDNINEETLRMAYFSAWAMVMKYAADLVIDDALDESTERDKIKSWHNHKGIGINAVNDAFFLYNSADFIVDENLSKLPLFPKYCSILKQSKREFVAGNHMDFLPMKNGKLNMDFFNDDAYKICVNYKGASNCSTPLLLLPMILGGIDDKAKIEAALSVGQDMGDYLQYADDFYDSCGKDYVSCRNKHQNKTDIKKGQVTWPILEALRRANPAQRKIIENAYGRPEAENVCLILDVFEELDIRSAFEEFEIMQRDKILKKIDQLDASLKQPLFLMFTALKHYLDNIVKIFA